MNGKNGRPQLGSALFVLLFLALAGCTSYVPSMSSDVAISNPNVKLTVLGSVSMRIDKVAFGEQLGIKALLLEEAKKNFPDASAVVDITYTGYSKGFLFFSSRGYIAEGTVVRFE